MADFDFSQMTPEQLDALMELGVLDDQDSQLQQQMAQAQALQQPSEHQYRTPAGALIGGLGNIFNAGMGGYQQTQIQKQQQDILDKKRKGRKLYAEMMLGRGQHGAPPSMPPMLEAPPDSPLQQPVESEPGTPGWAQSAAPQWRGRFSY